MSLNHPGLGNRAFAYKRGRGIASARQTIVGVEHPEKSLMSQQLTEDGTTVVPKTRAELWLERWFLSIGPYLTQESNRYHFALQRNLILIHVPE
jgi:hypothetical protein